MKEGVKYAGGLLLMIALFAWVLRGTDPAAVLRQVSSASPWALLGCAALNFGHNIFRVWRWQALLAPTRSGIPFRAAFAAVVVGYLTTWSIPGRLGEIVRPLLLSGREGVPLGPCIGTVVADRLLDAVTLAVLFAVGSFVTPLTGAAARHAELLRSGSIGLAAVALSGLAGMLIVAGLSPGARAKLARGPRVVRFAVGAIEQLSRGAIACARPAAAGRIALLSVAAWLSIAFGTWIGVRGVGADVPFGAILVILPMLALGVALPTPGGAGGYHGAMKVGLVAFGVAEPVAVGAGLVLHVLVTAPILVVGALLLWTEGISWRDLRAAARDLMRTGPEGGPESGPRRVMESPS